MIKTLKLCNTTHLWWTRRRATEHHLPFEITQCYSSAIHDLVLREYPQVLGWNLIPAA